MKNKENHITYIAFYNAEHLTKDEERLTFLSATNKINYITNTLEKLGYSIEILSLSWTMKSNGYFKGKTYKITDNIQFRTFDTFGSSSRIAMKLKQVFSVLQLIIYMIFRIKSHGKIIVYHSIGLMLPIKLLQNLINADFIIEVEEIYSKVWKGKVSINKEMAYLNNFNKYICVSDIVKNLFHDSHSIVLYGAYDIIDPSKYESFVQKKETIDIIYAGEIEDTRCGALNSVLCMKYLPRNYRLHILGFGKEKDVNQLKTAIKTVNINKNMECCKYYGAITGDAYHKFLFNGDIGINPQKEGEYMDTAFPSKILSYLSHNLLVVTTNIESIHRSNIAPYIIFSKNDEPNEIAKTILLIQSKDLNKRTSNLLKALDNNFERELKELLQYNNFNSNNNPGI